MIFLSSTGPGRKTLLFETCLSVIITPLHAVIMLKNASVFLKSGLFLAQTERSA